MPPDPPPTAEYADTLPYTVGGYEAVKPICLPDDLRGLVARFCAKHPPYATPQGAEGKCYDAANHFLNYLRAEGYISYPEDLRGHRYLLDEVAVIAGCSHHAALIDDFLIDFTARQFDAAAPFPLVWRASPNPRSAP